MVRKHECCVCAIGRSDCLAFFHQFQRCELACAYSRPRSYRGWLGVLPDVSLQRLLLLFPPTVAQSTGDGIFALFGAPIAHEDHPQRALLAAPRMQADVKGYAEKLRAEKGGNLQVRVGANTGEVVVRLIRTGENHSEYAPIGHSTGVAARLEALAAPGSIAISESMRKLVEGHFALKPRGPARIKGLSELLETYEVTGLGAAAHPPPTRGGTRLYEVRGPPA